MWNFQLKQIRLVASCVAWILVASSYGDTISRALSSFPGQKWGYSAIRPGAHMFYWLFNTTHTAGATKRPLIIWIQGGPGFSGVGHGNFAEIGPVDSYGNIRNHSWISEASLLFVDSPVGVGYSYVDSDMARPTSDTGVAVDLVKCLADVLDKLPYLKSVPLYIFGQSYGGKIAAVFAHQLHQAISSGEVVADLRGAAFGNSWVSPEHSMSNWAPFLKSLSVIDGHSEKIIRRAVNECIAAMRSGEWHKAAELWKTSQGEVAKVTDSMNWYNVVKPHYEWTSYDADDEIIDFMNGTLKSYIGIVPTSLHVQRRDHQSYVHLKPTFMQHALDSVTYLLSKTDVRVAVYQGQLDIICNTPGAYNWVDSLVWAGAHRWRRERPISLWTDSSSESTDNGRLLGFRKTAGNLDFYTILNAGHEVPVDQPEAALHFVDDFLNRHRPHNSRHFKHNGNHAETLQNKASVLDSSYVIITGLIFILVNSVTL